MARLNKTESGQVMALVDKPGWTALIHLASMTINELNAREVSGSNEFETLRSIHTRQGKVEALKEFFKGIEDGVSLSENR